MWPDWWGKAVAIVASGRSLKKEHVALLEGRLPVLAIKKNVELAPWAEVVYGCDTPWWRSVRGLPDFKGLRLAYEPVACTKYGLQKVDIERNQDRILIDRMGLVGSGGNSGFQALNLAVQWGASRVLLLGFDMKGDHWYGRNTANGMSNPGPDNFPRWIAAFNRAAEDLKGMDVDVVNASSSTAITGFRRAGVAETLEAWGL